MQYPDLVWTALGIIGGLLLLYGQHLSKTNWWGVGCIFVAFLFQVYWEIVTKPTGQDIFGLNVNLIGVTIILVIELPLLVWPGWLRIWISKKKPTSSN